MQLIGFDPTPDAALLLATRNAVERIDLATGQELSFELGERHCAGELIGDGHRACDRPETPRCPEHTETWICARCRGTCLKAEMDCHQEHAVYLAVVAPDRFKVGVTRAERVHTRLHEQGADRGAVINSVANGRVAREIEAELGRELPERISADAKIDGLTRSVDDEAWERLLARHEPIERIVPSYSVDFDRPPIPTTLAAGHVLGTKGRLLVLAFERSTYVTDLRDLVGYHVRPGSPSSDLQAGLGAFA